MTFSKRQFFIYRLKQCIKFLERVNKYFIDVLNYLIHSKFDKEFKKKQKTLQQLINELKEFLDYAQI
ncbi:MAG: hypothetical protein ACFE9S_19125 [Candidatus Hermodarchaeota archaeon]